MTQTSAPAVAGRSSSQHGELRSRAAALRSWRSAVGLAAIIGGGTVIAGCLLPWASTFAGLISFPGIDGPHGRVLAAAGAVMVIAGLWQLAGATASAAGSPAWPDSPGSATPGCFCFSLRRACTLLAATPWSCCAAGRACGSWPAARWSRSPPCSFRRRTSARCGPQPSGGGLAAWAADRESAGARRWLQLGLGLVWLLDAALQFQPFMFGRGFVTQIVDPTTMGSPAVIANSVTASGQVILAHAVLFNAAFAAVQLALAIGLFWRRTTRAALAGTIVWGLAVWWLGESFGMLFSGSASPLTGAPGAALLYVLLAVLAWPRRPASGRVTGREPAPAAIDRGVRAARPPVRAGRVGPDLGRLCRADAPAAGARAGCAARRCRRHGLGTEPARLPRPLGGGTARVCRPRSRPGIRGCLRRDRDRRPRARGGPARSDPGGRARGGDLGDRRELRRAGQRISDRPEHRPAAAPADRRVLAAAVSRW